MCQDDQFSGTAERVTGREQAHAVVILIARGECETCQQVEQFEHPLSAVGSRLLADQSL